MKLLPVLALVLMAMVLSACENSAASYEIEPNSKHTISLLREQRFVWKNEVEQKVVLARNDECQKRKALDNDAKAMTPLEVYELRPMLFVMRQGKVWYAAGTERCDLEKLDAAPGQTGRLLGRFEHKDGVLKFVK